MGGFPLSVSRSAMRHLSAFTTAAPPIVEPGPTGSSRPLISTIASPPGVPLSIVMSATSGRRCPEACLGAGGQAMLHRNDRDSRQAALFRLHRHFDDDLVDAAVRENDEAVRRAQDEVAEDRPA